MDFTNTRGNGVAAESPARARLTATNLIESLVAKCLAGDESVLDDLAKLEDVDEEIAFDPIFELAERGCLLAEQVRDALLDMDVMPAGEPKEDGMLAKLAAEGNQHARMSLYKSASSGHGEALLALLAIEGSALLNPWYSEQEALRAMGRIGSVGLISEAANIAEIESLKKKLAGKGATELEKVIAGRVALLQIKVNLLEAVSFSCLLRPVGSPNMLLIDKSIPVMSALFHETDVAHRQFITATSMLDRLQAARRASAKPKRARNTADRRAARDSDRDASHLHVAQTNDGAA